MILIYEQITLQKRPNKTPPRTIFEEENKAQRSGVVGMNAILLLLFNDAQSRRWENRSLVGNSYT